MLIFFAGLAGLVIKALGTYIKYTLIYIGKLKSPNRLSLSVLGQSWGFLLGTDVRGRLKAVGATRQIFARQQPNTTLTSLANSFRRSLLIMGLSVLVAFASVILAAGQPMPIIIGGLAAVALTIWGIVTLH